MRTLRSSYTHWGQVLLKWWVWDLNPGTLCSSPLTYEASYLLILDLTQYMQERNIITLQVRTRRECICPMLWSGWASQVALGVKNLPANEGDVRDAGSIPGLGGSPGGGHSNPLQYSHLENPVRRGAWWAAVHRVAQNRTWLKQLSTHARGC